MVKMQISKEFRVMMFNMITPISRTSKYGIREEWFTFSYTKSPIRKIKKLMPCKEKFDLEYNLHCVFESYRGNNNIRYDDLLVLDRWAFETICRIE